MNKKLKALLIISILLIILLLTVIVLGYFKKIDIEKELNTPEAVLGQYVEYLNNSNYSEMYQLLSTESKNKYSKQEIIDKYNEIYGNIGMSNIEITNMQTEKIDVRNSNITYTTKLSSIYGEIDFTNTVCFIKQDDKKYYIDWNYSAIYPGLEINDKITINKDTAKRGSLIDRNRSFIGRKWLYSFNWFGSRVDE